MRKLFSKSWVVWLVALVVLPFFIFNVVAPASVSRAEDKPASPKFQAVVDREDFPIVAGQVSRSWLYGPGGFDTEAAEPYAEGQGGTRLVQYYDKARLELTKPTGSVTSGLLAKEMMTGQLQLGDNKFEQHNASSQSVAGDPDDTLAPSYADLGLLMNRPAFTAGTVITTFIRASGSQSGVSTYSQYNVTAVDYPGAKHSIASVFKTFVDSNGVIFENGQFIQGKVFNQTFLTTGLPLTEPYWARAKIAGKVQDVLVQGFERRVMTYTPGNPEGYRVETGNVGRHYFDWRYNVTEVQLLGVNDFHGRLLPEKVSGVDRGGAAFITSKVNQLRSTDPNNTLLVMAGDNVGASQLQSALLQDEPTLQVLNLLKPDATSVGNHEFDKGITETLRLINGGKNTVRNTDWSGVTFPYLVANLEYKDTGKPLLQPYVIIDKGGVKYGIVGAVTKDLPTLVSPAGIAAVNVLDEATAINKYIPEMKQKGAQVIIVAIHEGGTPSVADGQEQVVGPIVNIAAKLDPAVDVVISGHTHQEYVAYMSGKLVTQSGYYTRNVTDVHLRLDNKNKKIVAKRAVNVPVVDAELQPDPQANAIVQKAAQETAPIANQKIATTQQTISKTQNSAGESALGDLIADSQKAAVGSDFAFMNPGGIRSDQPAGDITYGSLFTIQPFGNILVKVTITGDQVYQVLEQQWSTPNNTKILQIAGFSYTWDNSKPVGSRIVEVRGADGKPVDRSKNYTAVINNFLQAGGDGFTVFTKTTNPIGGPIDLDAFIDYVKKLPQPVVAPTTGSRIVRQN